MTTIGPRNTVPPPRHRTWSPGLVTAARVAETYIESPVAQTATDDLAATETGIARWGNGIAYRPELTFTRPDPESEGEVVEGPGEYITCPVDDELNQADKVAVGGYGTVEWDPYALYDADTCTTLSSNISDAQERARASLTRQTSHLLENVLWTGMVNGVDFTANHPNTALASSAADLPNGTNTVGIVTGLAMMVEALADALGGEQGMIHIPAKLLPFVNFYGQIVRAANTDYLYAGDHFLVTGTGYPGTGPSGQDGTIASQIVWIYGTSLVEVRLSGEFDIGVNNASVDQDTNDITVYAERLALAQWDRTAHIGIPICIPDPGPDCTTSS